MRRRKIGEPRAGFDLRKRTIGVAFSEGLPIAVRRAMVHDEPMHHTGAAVLCR
jgi:RNase H-fold protein (predicted Holliday junction resolvase)